MNIGVRLAELQKIKGISRNAFAKKSGVALSFINSIEKNEKTPTVITFKKFVF